MRCCMAGVFTLPGCARGFARHSLCMLGMHCAPAPRADACTACRMDTVVKVDMTAEQDAGMVAKIELPDGLVGGEFVFVSRAPPSVAAGGAEDDGWLVGYCTDPVRMESYCLVRPRPWPAIGTIVLPTVVLGRVHACICLCMDSLMQRMHVSHGRHACRCWMPRQCRQSRWPRSNCRSECPWASMERSFTRSSSSCSSLKAACEQKRKLACQ
jgi:hypothetical protein